MVTEHSRYAVDTIFLRVESRESDNKRLWDIDKGQSEGQGRVDAVTNRVREACNHSRTDQ